MPIYDYFCEDCDYEKSINHSFEDRVTECPRCGSNNFKKVLNNFLTVSKNSSDNKKVGSLTKEYIEENRKVLEDQKRELRKNKL